MSKIELPTAHSTDAVQVSSLENEKNPTNKATSSINLSGSTFTNNMSNFLAERTQGIRAAYKSLQVLNQLTPTQVESFMNSYKIYELDWKDREAMLKEFGPEYQTRVGECLKDYYSVLNHLCVLGELEKMYIPPIMAHDISLLDNQLLWEEKMAKELQVGHGSRVLDLGCGRGQVAAHVAKVIQVEVTGLNIDADQIKFAESNAKEHNLKNKFVVADFNKMPLPFGDNGFDGFYQIQALSLCEDLPGMCKELYRILRPGARLSMLDWCELEAFDPSNEHHKELLRTIKPLIGAVGTPTPKSIADALTGAGFEMLAMENASIDGLQAPLIEDIDAKFSYVRMMCSMMRRIGLVPDHIAVLLERLGKGCEAFVEADRARLFTTSYHWLARKPAAGEQRQGDGTLPRIH